MTCCLLAFYIVALGPSVSLQLFASRVYVASYHRHHVYLPCHVVHLHSILWCPMPGCLTTDFMHVNPPPVFLRRCLSVTLRKLHISVEMFFWLFFPSIWSNLSLELDVYVYSSFVHSGTTWLKCSCVHAYQLTILHNVLVPLFDIVRAIYIHFLSSHYL